MKLPIVSHLIRLRARSRLKQVMRGYRLLKKQGQLSIINELKDKLVAEKFKGVDSTSSTWMFGASNSNSELLIRQYLYGRVLNLRFNQAILYAIGADKPICHPLPLAWQIQLEENGFRVNRIICRLQWLSLLLVYFGFGIYRAIDVIRLSVFNEKTHEINGSSAFAYFNGLQLLNIPSGSKGMVSDNIIAWYAQWDGRNKEVTGFYHDAKGAEDLDYSESKVRYRSLSKQPLASKSLLYFLQWLAIALVITTKDLLLLRWWTFLLFEQYVQAARLRAIPDNRVAKDYLLHNSGWVYRPIWTYEAENRGARILFYFYATNVEKFKGPDGYLATKGGWQLASWPIVLVWDQYLAEFVRREFYSTKKIEMVGPIGFSSFNSEEIHFDFKGKQAVAIFDIQPHRASRYQSLGMPMEYYDSKVAIQFLKDIYDVLKEQDVVALHKRKREIGNRLHPKYRRALKAFSGENQISVTPDLSANFVISKVDFVISMPFTSTAILATEQGKASIFYDPFGDVQRDDRAAHGIPVIIGVDELSSWINNALR